MEREDPERPSAPKQVRCTTLSDYFDVMSQAVFQTGMGWKVVHNKWPGFREAFADFDVPEVASMTPRDVDRLAKDTRIIRNRPKIEATIHNAQALLDIEEAFKTFKKYLRSFDNFDALVRDMRKRFKFLGDTGCYLFLYVVKEPVPDFHDWLAPRMKARKR